MEWYCQGVFLTVAFHTIHDTVVRDTEPGRALCVCPGTDALPEEGQSSLILPLSSRLVAFD
jgi:hypothetical protein